MTRPGSLLDQAVRIIGVMMTFVLILFTIEAKSSFLGYLAISVGAVTFVHILIMSTRTRLGSAKAKRAADAVDGEPRGKNAE